MRIDILELRIEELFPNISNRQCFFVYPNESVSHASICLIPAIEVYIDGVIVVENSKPIGRIGSKHILAAYYQFGREIFYREAREIMHHTKDYITPNMLLKDLLNDMRLNRLGFVPLVSEKGMVVVSIYDVLRLLTKLRIDEPVSTIGSRLTAIDEDYSIRDALRIMLEKNIRRLFIIKDGEIYAIVGRDILDFILNNEVIEGKHIDISNLNVCMIKKHKMLQIKPETSISNAIILLLKQHAPSSLIIDYEYVVTPWDIVMKGISKTI